MVKQIELLVAVPFFRILVFSILSLLLGKESTFLVAPCLAMAKVLSSVGKATKAIEKYQHAITLLESNRGAESKDLVVPLLGLGNLLLKERRVRDAETHFTRLSFLFFYFPFPDSVH